MNLKKFESKIDNLIKKHKHIEIDEVYPNFPHAKCKNLGVRKVKAKYVVENSFYNLKFGSYIWFFNNVDKFKWEIDNMGHTVHLYKVKGKREYWEGEGGGNRIFFTKHFPKIIGRDYVYASVWEFKPKRKNKKVLYR